MKKEHWILGIMGKTGSGKSHLAKQILQKQRRYLVIDPLWEYPGIVFYDWAELVRGVYDRAGQGFKFCFRPARNKQGEADTGKVFRLMNEIGNYTAVIEEADTWCNPYFIHEDFASLMKYGRHSCINMLWISRNPTEVNRTLTRLSHALISYRQTEPIDLRNLRQYAWSEELSTLDKYQWAYNGDAQIITKLTGRVT